MSRADLQGHRSGYVALIGAPNAGKSTLLNRIIGQKISIVTPKPQTTRRKLLGICTRKKAQLLLLDTPGWHRGHGLLNRRMMQHARAALEETDVVLWLVDSQHGWTRSDTEILKQVRERSRPIVIAVNKVDRIGKLAVLPVLERVHSIVPEAEIVPVSALTGTNVDTLLDVLANLIPEGPRLYDASEITDEPVRSIVAELVREKVMSISRDEVPYGVAVTIDIFEEKKQRQVTVIRATIHVPRESHKPIVIGEGGRRLREIGESARGDIETLLGRRVFLELFVRVQADWTSSEARIRELGL